MLRLLSCWGVGGKTEKGSRTGYSSSGKRLMFSGLNTV